jgi:hypothetical protein
MYQHHLEKLTRTRLDDVLLDEGILERSRVADAQAEHEMTGKSLTGILLDQQAIDEWDLAKVIITHYSLPFVDLTDMNMGIEPETLLPVDFCRAHMMLPLDLFGRAFTLAVCEMPSTLLLQKIIEVSGKSPFLYVAVRRQIVEAIDALEKRKLRKVPGAAVAAPAAAAGSKPSVAPAVVPAAVVARRRRDDDAALVPIDGILPVSMKLSASVSIRSRRGTQETRPVAANPAESGWQSIFDIGDDAVRSD